MLSLGGFLGAYLGGKSFEWTGSYRSIFLGLAVSLVTAWRATRIDAAEVLRAG